MTIIYLLVAFLATDPKPVFAVVDQFPNKQECLAAIGETEFACMAVLVQEEDE